MEFLRLFKAQCPEYLRRGTFLPTPCGIHPQHKAEALSQRGHSWRRVRCCPFPPALWADRQTGSGWTGAMTAPSRTYFSRQPSEGMRHSIYTWQSTWSCLFYLNFNIKVDIYSKTSQFLPIYILESGILSFCSSVSTSYEWPWVNHFPSLSQFPL